MINSLLSVISLIIALIILSCHPQANGSDDDGIYVSNTKVIETTVDSVNLPERIVVLRDKEGKLYPVEVGEEIKGLSEIEAGNKVRMEYNETFEMIPADPDEKLGAHFDTKYADPSSAKELTTDVDVFEEVSQVEAIDIENRIVTLKGADGDPVMLKVDDSVKRLDEVKVGDKIKTRYTRSLTISVK